jgi:predicted HD phosphohydrolase
MKAMETVSFTSMADGTKEDYEILARHEERFADELPDRLLAALVQLKESVTGYRVSRYEHSLQGATRAVAAILKPFVRPEVAWIVGHHGAFQLYYYGHHRGLDRNARDAWKDHEWYEGLQGVLRALRPELLRPGLRLGAARDVRAHGPPGLLRAPVPPRRLRLSLSRDRRPA